MERLHGIAQNMLMEGTESGTICALLEQASEFPEEQKRVQEELDSVIGHERLPSFSDKAKLPYTDAFIQELFRMSMPFNVSSHYCNFSKCLTSLLSFLLRFYNILNIILKHEKICLQILVICFSKYKSQNVKL